MTETKDATSFATSSSAFISSGGYGALKACASDLMVSPRRVGKDPFENVYVDVFFNYRPGYQGASFGEADVNASSVHDACMQSIGNDNAAPIDTQSTLFNNGRLHTFNSSNDDCKGQKLSSHLPSITEMDASNSDDVGVHEQSVGALLKHKVSAEHSVTSTQTVQPYGNTTPTNAVNANKVEESSSVHSKHGHVFTANVVDNEIVPAFRNLRISEQMSQGNRASIHSPQQKEAGELPLDLFRDSSTDEEAPNSSKHASTKVILEPLPDEEWIARTETIHALMKQHSRPAESDNEPSDVIEVVRTTPLMAAGKKQQRTSWRAAKDKDESMESTTTKAPSLLERRHSSDRLCEDTDKKDFIALVQDSTDTRGERLEDRSRQKSLSLDQGNMHTIDIRPKTFTMDGFESGADTSSMASMPEALAKPGVEYEPLDEITPNPNTEPQKNGNTTTGAMGVKKEEMGNEGEGAQRMKVQTEETNDTSQAGCGLLKQTSLREVLQSVRRTISRGFSSSRSKDTDEEVVDTAVEGNGGKAVEIAKEKDGEVAQAAVRGDANGSESNNSGDLFGEDPDTEDMLIINTEAACSGAQKEKTGARIRAEDRKNSPAHEIKEAVQGMRKVPPKKMSLKRALGGFRRIGSKERQAQRDQSAAPEVEGVSEVRQRSNFLKKMLSRSKSRDVADTRP